ncbi:MAG: DUF523 domain-containing protein [Clostridium sp.]
MYIISACLCGVNCRYNGKSSTIKEVVELVKSGKGILVCPEQLGGMETPRVPCEIICDLKVINKDGDNKTKEFLSGANEVLTLCKNLNIKKAILKENSPSCGSNFIYNGKFNGGKIRGMGVTTALLRENGIEVFSEENFNRGELK